MGSTTLGESSRLQVVMGEFVGRVLDPEHGPMG
jgi:hypothetical protein